MKFKIYNNLSFEKLLKVVPSRYKNLISALSRNDEFDVVIFLNDSEVVLSGTANKAIKGFKKTDRNRILALGYCFMIEARILFRENGFEMIELRSFEWTDESYTAIKQKLYKI